MFRRIFILCILIHTLSIITISSLTNTFSNSPFSKLSTKTFDQTNPTHSEESLTAEYPFFYLIQHLFEGTEQRRSESKSDNISDFFRIRKYNYHFLLWKPLLMQGLIRFFDHLLLSEKTEQPGYFEGLLTLPEYYRFLFRLTPF